MGTGKTTFSPSAEFKSSDYLKTDSAGATYLKEMLADGDTRALPIALRALAHSIGMTELAKRTGLARESLYRTLNGNVSPRLDTIMALLDAFGLRIMVARKARAKAA